MAFISKKCVECTEPTKRKAGAYSSRDKQGEYHGDLFTCNNGACPIRYSNQKSKRMPLKKESKESAVHRDTGKVDRKDI